MEWARVCSIIMLAYPIDLIEVEIEFATPCVTYYR